MTVVRGGVLPGAGHSGDRAALRRVGRESEGRRMTRAKTFRMLAALLATVAGCSIGSSEGHVFTLYRNSVTDENMRIHVATFDAAEKEEYNRENCEQAQVLFQAQRGIKVKFWCEKGRFRK
jgi:hypothetical protein